MNIIEDAKRALKIESEAITSLIERIDESFVKAVEKLYNCKGRIVVTGVGKSGIIAQKVAATLASTGTPAYFLHPTEAIHGSLGMIVQSDVVMIFSNSGETEEINQLLPAIKRRGAEIIALTGNMRSTLATNSDVVLDTSVKEEACPLGLAPTASTTAALAMGDALAVALLKKRDFKEEDFAMLHPGGSLGRRLILRVKDIMHKGNEIPMVKTNASLKDVLFEMTSKRLGVTTVVDRADKLVGIITDGDLRRLIEGHQNKNIWVLRAIDFMTKNPKTIDGDALAMSALQKMEEYAITSLVIVNEENRLEGIVHLHDILKAEIV
jgi:arabinose-5-phosphate isomerase